MFRMPARKDLQARVPSALRPSGALGLTLECLLEPNVGWQGARGTSTGHPGQDSSG